MDVYLEQMFSSSIKCFLTLEDDERQEGPISGRTPEMIKST